MIKRIVISVICLLAQVMLAADARPLTDEQGQELLTIIRTINRGYRHNVFYQESVMQHMLTEASFFSDQLGLPTAHPIRNGDVLHQFTYIGAPWFAVIKDARIQSLPATIYGTNLCNTNISRDVRLNALKFGVSGTFETTNFSFSFEQGKLWDIQHLSHHLMEYYADNLDGLIGKPSLIDTNGAYQLATQWLAAVGADMPALEKLKWTVSQLHYKARGATNYVTLPLFYVDIGTKHFHWPKGSQMKDTDEPLITVEILGTTKELQELRMEDASFSRRPLLLITNAIDLLRMTNPPIKYLE